MRRRLLACLIAVTSLLGVAAVARGAAVVHFAGIGGGSRVRPQTVFLSADGTLDVSRVSWQSWGTLVATGRGVAEYHGCTPSCAAARDHTAQVTVTMSDPVPCPRTRDFAAGVYFDTVSLRARPGGRTRFANDLHGDRWAPCRQ